MYICIIQCRNNTILYQFRLLFVCSEKFPKDISSSVLKRLDSWRHKEDKQWFLEVEKCTQKLSFLWSKTLTCELQKRCPVEIVLEQTKKVVAGNTVMYSLAIQETMDELWKHVCEKGKICQYADIWNMCIWYCSTAYHTYSFCSMKEWRWGWLSNGPRYFTVIGKLEE
jgi:hypothetical protein